ncbi:MAG: hypothetical protein JWN71_4207 [Xanthobacteraceae bacterium]|nr:hypothetical protein [Xanthobacteraceae bacterium]
MWFFGFLLIIAYLVLPIITLVMISGHRERFDRLGRTLAAMQSQLAFITDRLNQLQRAALPPSSPPAPSVEPIAPKPPEPEAAAMPPAPVPPPPAPEIPEPVTPQPAVTMPAASTVPTISSPLLPEPDQGALTPEAEQAVERAIERALEPEAAGPSSSAPEPPIEPPATPPAQPSAAPERLPFSDAAFGALFSAAASKDSPPNPPSSGPDFADLEKRFGTQWVVWVGGLALALGGIFLVRYSIEQGLFTPALRILFGALLAFILVGLGELARRREQVAPLTDLTNAHIPAILTAVGTTIAYADVYAAYALYEFVSPAFAFVLLGIVALATLAAALLHGPALAGLGLIGAYVTPALVSANAPNYWTLYVYLAVVSAAAYALARVRMWRWLAITAATLSILWMFVGIADPTNGSLSAHAFFAVAGFALASVFIVAGLWHGPAAEPGRVEPVSCGVLAGYLFGAFMLVMATAHAPLSLITLAALIAATVAITWRTEATMLAVPAAAILGVLVVIHWALDYRFLLLVGPNSPFAGIPLRVELIGLSQHLGFAVVIAALFGAAGFQAQGRTEQPPFALVWSVTAVATPIVILIALYFRIAELERSLPFAGVALILAALFALATERLIHREPKSATKDSGTLDSAAIFAVGAIAALALALTFALERGWLTVALALMAPGIAFVADKRPIPMLRKLCGVIAALVLARVAWNPSIVGSDVGTTPIFNWLLWGYGVPALSFWAAGHLLRRRADDGSSRSVDSAAILFVALTAFLEIRHLMNDGDIFRPSAGLGELGLQISTGLAMTIGLEHLRGRSGSIIHDYGARIFVALAFVGIVFGLAVNENPLRTGEPVGGLFFNYILLGYAIPAVLMGVLARTVKHSRPPPYYLIAAITAIVLALAYLSLEVRTLFHGAILSAPFVTDAEDYTYSAVWLGFGVALLVAGVLLRSQPARFASAAVVTLTIAKVFLHDLAGVQGIYRAFSFIGLGVVLMSIGWLYQRLLFPPRRLEPEAPVAEAPTP